jgi:hypothetical protein
MEYQFRFCKYDEVKNETQWKSIKSLVKLFADSMISELTGKVDWKWIESHVLTKTEAILLVYRADTHKARNNSNDVQWNCVGFALLEFKIDHIYISMLCAKGGGRALIEEIKSLSQQYHLPYIVLAAVPYVINFYRKLGFRHCLPGQQESRIIYRGAQAMINKTFRTNFEAVYDLQFHSFLKLLLRSKLGQDSQCTLVEHSHVSGFIMSFQCNNEKKKEPEEDKRKKQRIE